MAKPALDATGFFAIKLSSGNRAWLDGYPVTNRIVVQRKRNRFQAYELLEGDFLSVGWLYTRDDIRLFLKGHAVEICTALAGDAQPDPTTFHHPALTTF